VTLSALVRRSVTYYWRTNLAVILGVAAAVSVLAGALVVGDSVRGSLRDIALGRLGRTDQVVASSGFFRDALAADLKNAAGVTGAAPLVIANGFVTHEASGRRSAGVLVYGVDERFWQFNGLDVPDGVYASPALATELSAKEGDVLLTRLQRPSEIPIESLFGRKDEVGRTVRLTVTGVLPRERLGEFALQPQQTEVRAVFAPLRRIQRDLAVPDQVNTVLVSGTASLDALRSTLKLEDIGARVTVTSEVPAVAVESASGIISEELERAALQASKELGFAPVPIFTYLANSIRKGDRRVPYSLITAIDLSRLPAAASPRPVTGEQLDRMVLNEWAARELGAVQGDRLEIEYYLWDPVGGLQTKSASFTLTGIVPIAGLAADRTLAPTYPGITKSPSLADWDPPFPIDLSRVREQDEKYWDVYRTTPKAFISYERGRDLWRSRYGAMTSVRFDVPAGTAPDAAAARLQASLSKVVSPQAMGVSAYAARRQALEASTGATDFGEYFTYFSFFLVVSALMLAVLFFKLGIEQRLRQIAILRASGYTVGTIRRLFLAEAVVLALIGALIGVADAVLYARVIVHGLRTWWVGAVGTTLLEVHVTPVSLIAGAVGGIVAAIACIFVSLRAVARMSPRSLLTAHSLDAPLTVDASRSRRNTLTAAAFAVLGVLLMILGFVLRSAQAGAFFGAGAALLIAFLTFLAGWLRARDARLIKGRGTWAVSRLGFRSAAFRPGRSVLSAALIAAAAFIIVSVDAFRRGGGDFSGDPKTGTGGYAVLARAELPVLHDPNTRDGREAMLIQAPELANARFTRFRVRQGQDASCLNLFRPTNPTIIAPEPGFIEANRFTVAASLADSDAERANPWTVLNRRFEDGTVPVIADATSLQYVLHARVGDTFSIDTGSDQPIVLRFVGALKDSVLQGELIVSEQQFIRMFPTAQGYRMFLIEDPGVRAAERARMLADAVERELQPFGVDAVTTGDRLEEFHRVENTYLSTFQALGGLGLLLGTVGLATVMFRNVLERRRELALLRAVGFNAGSVSTMILAEAAFLLGAGLLAGAVCAAIAIAPAWLGRGGTLPGAGLIGLLVGVVVAGLLSSFMATRAALSGKMLDALRAE
jgi:ABC-type lipoprotein release transport system permease subunit